MLDAWLVGADLPDGLTVDADLRARILWALTARGEARDADIDALPALDPVPGEVNRAMGTAMRPTAEAKEAGWAAALSPGTPARIAEAYATGLWTPGREELMAGYRDRYFADALPRLAGRSRRMAQRLSRLLFPSILVSEETIEVSAAYTDTGVIVVVPPAQPGIGRATADIGRLPPAGAGMGQELARRAVDIEDGEAPAFTDFEGWVDPGTAERAARAARELGDLLHVGARPPGDGAVRLTASLAVFRVKEP